MAANWSRNDWINYLSSAFNLMNVAIGSGIIGLGSVANSMGYVPYIVLNILVASLAIYTLDLLCRCASRAKSWNVVSDEDDVKTKLTSNPHPVSSTDEIKEMEGGDIQSVPFTTYEEIGERLYGVKMMLLINISIIFYLSTGMCSFMTLIHQIIPEIVVGVMMLNNKNITQQQIEENIFTQGDIILLLVTLCILVPLGLFPKLDFLGFTSAFGMCAMITFVGMVIHKQPYISGLCAEGVILPGERNINYNLNSTNFYHNITDECNINAFHFTNESIYGIGICIFAYMCHTNVLIIYGELKSRSRRRMQLVIASACIPCTLLYIIAAMFAYASFYNHTQAQLIELYSFLPESSVLIILCKILVITCIIFSIPLALFPARISCWKLLYHILPQYIPKPYDADDYEKKVRFPWIIFIIIMLVIYTVMYFVVISAANFKLFISLAGTISGSGIIMIFPALFHMKLEHWNWRTFENTIVIIILIIGLIVCVGNASVIIYNEAS